MKLTIRVHDKICNKCNKKYRKLRYYQGKHYCYLCICKTPSYKMMNSICNRSRVKITLLDALNKIYHVNSYINKRTNTISNSISIPSVLFGAKVKLILVDDNGNPIDVLDNSFKLMHSKKIKKLQ